MVKLKPMYLYRLRLVSAQPRFYALTSINRYLERRGLIERTGRTDDTQGRVEYVITAAGRKALGAASGA